MRNDKKLKKVQFLLQYDTLEDDVTQNLLYRLGEEGIKVSFASGDALETERDDILWVTDCPETADTYEKKVLIYLHAQNNGMDFTGCTYFIEGFEDADARYFTRIYERLHGIPWKIAKTERLNIREMTVEDLDAVYSLYENPELIPFLPPLQENREEEKEYLRRYIKNMYGIFEYGMWLIETTDGEVIGRMGVENSEEEDVLSFGFLVHPKHWQKGYATEAGKAVLEYLKEEFPDLKVVAFCHPQNLAARNLCDKLGICVKSIM